MHSETETTQNEYMLPFLVTATLLLNRLAKLCLQLYVEGKYGRDWLDFCLRLLEAIICIIEVKKENFDQGMTQNVIQLHLSFETENISMMILLIRYIESLLIVKHGTSLYLLMAINSKLVFIQKYLVF